MPALHLHDRTMHGAGADFHTAVQHDGDRLQEGIATLNSDRPGSGHDGVELGVREAERHGSPHRACATPAAGVTVARVDGVPFAKGPRSLTAAGPFLQAL